MREGATPKREQAQSSFPAEKNHSDGRRAAGVVSGVLGSSEGSARRRRDCETERVCPSRVRGGVAAISSGLLFFIDPRQRCGIADEDGRNYTNRHGIFVLETPFGFHKNIKTPAIMVLLLMQLHQFLPLLHHHHHHRGMTG